ncbi:MAG: tetratricopeptide repeat protein [Deltaproteobacteria bacterium]|nr:tetratricopeptide repeat protein [Deltaproteobacteria bacterium]
MLITAALLALCASAEGPAKKDLLDRAQAALTDFRPEEAVKLLERAKEKGPHGYAAHARLYELLGIAYAYLERTDDALGAFDTLLAIDPGRAISYTLSPKVTFLFEQARGKAAARPPPSVQVSWSYDLMVGEEIPIQIEVIADPYGFLKRAHLHHRLRGSPTFESIEIVLPPPGQRTTARLPPVAADRPEAVELHLEALDAQGNEVLKWASAERPRDVSLGFDPPTPWYGRWWVWGIAGGVVAAGAAAAALALTQEPSPSVRGTFEVGP